MSTTSFKAGQHIRASRFFYWHHGIFWGIDADGIAWVIAFGTPMNPHAISYVTLAEFRGGGRIEVVHHECSYSLDVVLQRATGRIGQGQYNAFSNNCEHFANWCATGVHESQQTQLAVAVASVALLVGLSGGLASTSA